MTRSVVLCVILAALLAICYCEDVQQLFNKMSVEDKCGQMTQITYDVIQPRPFSVQAPINMTTLRMAIKEKRVGSILNAAGDYAQSKTLWQSVIKTIQDTVKQETDLKIPILYGIDSIHGATYIQEATLFPQPLSMAASFNLDISRRVGQITATETRAVGIPWNFNPVLDVGRQPLWPRLYETYGEDTYLATKMGEAYIQGHQGNDLKNRTFAATCLKHYIGYSLPFNGRDRTPAFIPDVLLREHFLPPFAQGVAAGSPTVMINSGEVNGIMGHANSYYINDILKGELKFEGFTVSDWEDIKRLHTRDKVAETPEEAVRMGVMAGVDMSMVPFDFSFYDHCVDLAKKDGAFMNRVNDATMRILKVKNAVGIFEDPYPHVEDLDKVGADSSHDFNLEAARESIILAKNERNTLPIQDRSRKILVTGPTANLLRVLNGGWSYVWQGNREDYFETFGRAKKTVFASVKSKASNAVFVEGTWFNQTTDLNNAVAQAQNSDLIILCIGEDTYTETPGNINSLMISESQQKLADALFAVNKPVVVVYLGGRPRIISDIAEKASAVLIGFLPGNRGAEAIADIIFGDTNPSAKLPITYPRHPNGITTYDHLSMESKDGNTYENLYPFGHGLSYTQFQYSDLSVSTAELAAPNSLNVQVKVKNVGNREGKEVVMLFLNDEYGSVQRPLKQLKKFEKITLRANEERAVSFTLNMDDLSFINAKSQRVYESGRFFVFVEKLNATFTLRVQATTTLEPKSSTSSGSALKFNSMLTSIFFLLSSLIF